MLQYSKNSDEKMNSVITDKSLITAYVMTIMVLLTFNVQC